VARALTKPASGLGRDDRHQYQGLLYLTRFVVPGMVIEVSHVVNLGSTVVIKLTQAAMSTVQPKPLSELFEGLKQDLWNTGALVL